LNPTRQRKTTILKEAKPEEVFAKAVSKASEVVKGELKLRYTG